jgi:hypothetical protein
MIFFFLINRLTRKEKGREPQTDLPEDDSRTSIISSDI